MRAEIIASGSELLLGQSVDTNGPWIANELSKIGVDCHFKTVVGDNIENLANTFRLALSRADIILCTGGLGPTQDDISREALAKAVGAPLIFDEALAERIRQKFKRRNRTMTENNLRQAYYPEGSTLLSAHPGTAPGILFTTEEKKMIFLMPGVPSEMKIMMEESVLPHLLTLLPTPEKIYTKTLRCWGLGESDIAEMLSEINDELDHKSNPKLSFLASGIEGIQVRFSAKSATEAEALTIIEPYLKRAEHILGEYCFGYDDESMEQAVQKLLEASDQQLALYETFSRGLIAERLNRKSDTRAYFRGSLVESDRRQPLNRVEMEHRLKQISALFQSTLLLSVTGEIEQDILKLTLYRYDADGLHSELLTIPYFNHDAAVNFSVINTLNYLRLSLLHKEEER